MSHADSVSLKCLINSLQNQLSEAESEVMELRARAADERETIQAASAMSANSEAIARQVAETQMKDIQESFASLIALMFNALGIEESMLALEANNVDMQPGKALNLTYAELKQYAAIHQQALATMRSAQERNSNLPSQTESI